MTSTKAITPIKPLIVCGFLALVLGAFAAINLLTTITPFAARDHDIERAFNSMSVMTGESRRAAAVALLPEQESVLARIPSEPFAWARLAYLRQTAGHDPEAAFQALRMSNMVSPNEPRQKLERALMWYDLRAVEDTEQQAYQTELWKKVIDMPNDKTWQDLKARGLVTKAKDILLTTDPSLYNQLVSRE